MGVLQSGGVCSLQTQLDGKVSFSQILRSSVSGAALDLGRGPNHGVRSLWDKGMIPRRSHGLDRTPFTVDQS